MTLSRDRGLIVFECDECGDTEETETRDFAEAREHIRAEGWTTQRSGDDWLHVCRGCSS